MQLWFTTSELGKAELYAELADKRVGEMISLAGEGSPEQIEMNAQRLDTYLNEIADLASNQVAVSEAALTVDIDRAPPPKEEEETVESVIEEPVTTTPPSPSEQALSDEWEDAEVDRLARLKMIVTNYAINHPAQLQRSYFHVCSQYSLSI